MDLSIVSEFGSAVTALGAAVGGTIGYVGASVRDFNETFLVLSFKEAKNRKKPSKLKSAFIGTIVGATMGIVADAGIDAMTDQQPQSSSQELALSDPQ